MIEILVNGKWPLKVPDHKINQEWWNVWEKERLQAMFETIKPGDIIFDIGAEEGDFAALFQIWAGKKGKLVIVEPSQRMWPCIKGIWEANGLEAPLASYQAFCGAHATDGEMYCGYDSWPITSKGDIVPDPGFYNIKERPDKGVVTIDNLSLRHGLPNVVTIDVEGAEFEVLKGATIVDMKKTVFFVSVHPSFMENDWSYTSDVLIAYMENAGYKATLLAIDHEEHWKFEPLTRQTL